MKQIFLLMILFPSLSFCQTPLSYTGIVELGGVSKEQLFTRARQWLNESFKSSKDVLQIADKESGELAGKGFTTVTSTYHYLGKHDYPANVHFAINIWVKDGKYKYELKNFEADVDQMQDIGTLTDEKDCPVKWRGTPQKMMNELWDSIKTGTDKDAKSLIASLEEGMKKKAANDF